MKKYLHGEFSPKKLNMLEKDLNKMYARYKKLKTITPITIIFSVIAYGVGCAFALRYVEFLNEYMNYDSFFLFSGLQKLVDGFYFKGDSNYQFFISIVLLLVMNIISLIASIIVITLLNIIKNTTVAIKSIKPLYDNDQVEKIKILIKRAKEIEFYNGGLINGRHSFLKELGLAILADLIAVLISVFFGLNDNRLPAIIFFGGLFFIILLIVTTIPFFFYYNLGVVGFNQKFGNYSKKVYEIKTILDNWWLELDPAEKTRRIKALEKEHTSHRTTYSTLGYIPDTKTTSSLPDDHGPLATATNCGMPPIDVNGM